MITVHRLNFILKQSIIYTGDDVPMLIKELNITDSNKPLISVIIPVYNVQEYLQQCLCSILNQTYRNIEIILIDDGSKDSSASICDEFTKKDERITVFHEENQGQGAARNYGVMRSHGKYIAFIDSDDYVSEEYIERLYNLLKEKNVEIACCDGYKFENKVSINNHIQNYVKVYETQEALENLLYQGNLTNSPWCKLIKADIVRSFPFPTGVGYEDMAVVYKWFSNAESIAYTDSKLYFYRQVANSTMHLKFYNKKIDRIYHAEQMKELIDAKYPQLFKPMCARFFLANIQTLMWLLFEKEYRYLYHIIDTNIKNVRRVVIHDKKAKKSHRIMALVSYLGIYPLRLLGGFYRLLIS